MYKYIKFFMAALILLSISCSTANNKPLSIGFSADSNKIVLTNINEVGLYQLKTHLATDSAFQQVVSVLQTPGENDSTSMEVEWPGKLSIVGANLLFTPEKPFEKSKVYLVETLLNTQFASGKDILKSNVDHKVKAQQVLLKR